MSKSDKKAGRKDALPITAQAGTPDGATPAPVPGMTDVQTLRDRARKSIDDGAVTESYLLDRKAVVRLLNEALATEWVCVLRYYRHYYMASGMLADSVKAEFLEHAQQELAHANLLSERIVQLGGAPDLNPDTLFVFVPAGQAGTFAKQFAERGLDKAGIKLIGPGDIVDDNDLPGMGDAMLGVVTAGIYSAYHNSPANKAYVADFKKANNYRPNFISLGGYDGMHLIYEALKKTQGNTDGDSLIAAMKGMKWESPRGMMSIDPDTRDIVQPIYIRKVEKINGELWNTEFAKFDDVKDPLKVKK